ncbi:polysaccharide deacetylase family protein [Methylopila sp. 73B]|uniref:polysaccharide deacetylase family protein n=1 Tax=Methylopila sp. 73B TaxID=1120792 RepID=UPI00037465DE|nr:polysaccharide deacetylase family protein [Methylopila sp. 73B]
MRLVRLLAVALGLAPFAAQAADVEPRLTIVAPDASARTVALTLDACSGATDHRVLDMLVAEAIPATVFVTHRWIRSNPAGLATLKAHPELFEIENHGENHVPAVTDVSRVFGLKTAGSLEAVRAEVAGGAAAVEAATGVRPRWYRDATARYSPDAVAEIKAQGFSIAGYSLNADMGASLMAPTVARRVAAAKSGDVIIAHINQPGRAAGEGLAAGVRALKAAGARFVLLKDVETQSDDGPETAIAVRKAAPAQPGAAPKKVKTS